MKMKKPLFGLLIWSGLLGLVMAAFLIISQPTPLQAQTGVVRFNIVSVGRFLRLVPRTAISVTADGYITPTGSYQRLDSAGNVATSGANVAVMTAGTMLVLVNHGSNTITLTETGTLISAGNIALGPEDSAILLSDGTSWRQISGSNN